MSIVGAFTVRDDDDDPGVLVVGECARPARSWVDGRVEPRPVGRKVYRAGPRAAAAFSGYSGWPLANGCGLPVERLLERLLGSGDAAVPLPEVGPQALGALAAVANRCPPTPEAVPWLAEGLPARLFVAGVDELEAPYIGYGHVVLSDGRFQALWGTKSHGFDLIGPERRTVLPLLTQSTDVHVRALLPVLRGEQTHPPTTRDVLGFFGHLLQTTIDHARALEFEHRAAWPMHALRVTRDGITASEYAGLAELSSFSGTVPEPVTSRAH